MDAKNTIKSVIICIAIALALSGCKKEKLHKIKYTMRILNYGVYGGLSMPEIGIWPRYTDSIPRLGYGTVEYWEYEYLGLKKGDYVSFITQCRLSTYLEKHIYIDDKEVAYSKIKYQDYKYYNPIVVETRGYGDSVEYRGFTYLEN